MERELNEDRSAVERGRPFQFGLWTLLVTVAVVALVCMVFFVLPDAISHWLLILMQPLTATILLAAAVYARGNLQAFCVGAMVPAIGATMWHLPWFPFGAMDVASGQEAVDQVLALMASGAFGLKLDLAITWGTSLFCGLVSLLVARGLQRQRRGRPDDERDDEPG